MDSHEKDPREQYLSLISIPDSHVRLHPPIVFLFGGTIDPPQSVRGTLYNHILVKHPSLSKNLVIPEDFKDWLHDSVYPDLLTFESDLAQTSTLIIIALESPGSIAELGSFSVNGALKGKIVTILSEHHHNQDSFIKLGPLRQLKDENVYSYPYDHLSPATTLSDYLDDIVQNIQDTLASSVKTERFNRKSNGHIAMLIFELISIFKALKLSEVERYLCSLGVELKKADVKRLLFLLGKLSFIEPKRMGNVDYFVPTRTDNRVAFASKDTSRKFDKNAAIMGVAQYYASSQKEKLRKRVIDATRGGV